MALRMLGRTLAPRVAGVGAGRAWCGAATMKPRWITTESREALDKLVKSNDIVVFMKGTPEAPQCGFSRTVCVVLEMHGVNREKMVTKDVLADSKLRSDIKEYSEWPTIPQVYVKGEFVGGCDIIVDMHHSGELVDLLETIGHKSTAVLEEEEK